MREIAPYLSNIRRHPVLPGDEQAELAKRAQSGDRAALERLVESNLRLVVTIAKRYWLLPGSLDDKIQAGNMGLMRAVPGFRPDRGMKFSSYAVMWIKAYIRRQFDLTHFKFEVPEGNHVRRTAGNPARVDDSLSILERAEQVRRAGRALELDPVRRLVMERRLFGGESLQAVGNILGLCRERVRQLERDVVELIRERLPREA